MSEGQEKGSKVIEIRVHGVGGTPPEHLLGENNPHELIRVAGSGPSAFFVRRRDKDRDVEGFAWGALTSGALSQPLWIFLLPFTLVNVAGWMLPPRGAAKRGWWKVARAIVILLGLTLTATYVFGLSTVVIKQVFYQSMAGVDWPFLWGNRYTLRILTGAIVMLLLGVLVARVAGKKQQRFEQVPRASEERPDLDPGFLGRKAFRSAFREDDGLRSPDFWHRPNGALSLLYAHLGVAFITLVVITGWALANAGSCPSTALRRQAECVLVQDLGFKPLFAWWGLAQSLLVFALFVTCLLGFRNPRTWFMSKRYFRYFAPVVATTTAFGLAGGFFSGLATLVGNLLQKEVNAEGAHVGGPELSLDNAYGLSTIAFFVAVIAVGIALWLRRKDELSAINDPAPPGHIPPNTTTDFEEPTGLADPGAIATKRSFARALRNIDIPLTVAAIVFVITSAIVLMFLLGVDGLENIASREGKFGWAGGFADWFNLFAVVTLLVTLRSGYLKGSQRRTFGIIWDVLTFWPRRFHPLAVRPYSEVAVPQLEGRICRHTTKPDTTVLLSTHSQGTILGYAALLQVAESDPDAAKKISLLTYGSPLSSLHSAFFPGYFSPCEFTNLAAQLSPQTVMLGPDAWPANWQNFYRLTDYIGQHVDFADPSQSTAARGAGNGERCSLLPSDPVESAKHNHTISDPATSPTGLDMSIPNDMFGPPDAPKPIWIAPSLHSHYNTQDDVKLWVAAVKSTL